MHSHVAPLCVALVLLLAVGVHCESALHSFSPPFLSQSNTAHLTLNGSAVVSDDKIRLTPAEKGKRGGVWTKALAHADGFEVELAMQITGQRSIGADGMAFWFVEEAGDGPVYGAPDMWKGLMIGFETFDNDMSGDNPKAPFHVLITYKQGVLTVDMDLRTTGRWENVLYFENVVLPGTGYFGVTAMTGGVVDAMDVASMSVTLTSSRGGRSSRLGSYSKDRLKDLLVPGGETEVEERSRDTASTPTRAEREAAAEKERERQRLLEEERQRQKERDRENLWQPEPTPEAEAETPSTSTPTPTASECVCDTSDLEASLETMAQRLDSVQGTATSLAAKVAEAEAKLKDQAATQSALDKSYEATKRDLTSQVDLLTKRLDTAAAKHARMASKYEAQEDELTTLRQGAEDMEARLTLLLRRMATLEAAFQAITAQVEARSKHSALWTLLVIGGVAGCCWYVYKTIKKSGASQLGAW
ncbi:hypothetical protein KIPB_002820 [Kipferlia bialata]|uniref:L-type lectin-like domain-containing protein n=1 Tax=Kipferlia bialata TaxID=797122 RepID=A0A9K3CUF6_9EUKA|nr:hypothetical protein KIPB_002820 [Kipferlia bialata]|eukprot:g2820.t1